MAPSDPPPPIQISRSAVLKTSAYAGGLGFGICPQFAIPNPYPFAIEWMNPERSSYKNTSTGYLEKALSGETRVEPVGLAWTTKTRSKGSRCAGGSRSGQFSVQNNSRFIAHGKSSQLMFHLNVPYADMAVENLGFWIGQLPTDRGWNGILLAHQVYQWGRIRKVVAWHLSLFSLSIPIKPLLNLGSGLERFGPQP